MFKALVDFFTDGRRAALSGWALNLSVVVLPAGLLSDVFGALTPAWRAGVLGVGAVLAVFGVLVAPPKGG